jgi:leucyl/phenylalanyl-tRNA--protein transferase
MGIIVSMPVYRLDSEIVFPPAEHADPSGLLAVGGGLEPERLLLAYASGIFPWFSEGQPVLWHAPDPRMVLRASDLHTPRSGRSRRWFAVAPRPLDPIRREPGSPKR